MATRRASARASRALVAHRGRTRADAVLAGLVLLGVGCSSGSFVHVWEDRYQVARLDVITFPDAQFPQDGAR